MRDRLGPGEVRNHPVMLQDVMPTLLNLAGIDVPPTCDGTSIASIWEDGDAPFREYAFGRYGYGNTAHYGLTDSRMKYMYWVEGRIEQLFNVTEDPNECHDLSQDLSYADELNKWRSRLIAELEKHGDGNMQNGELVKSTPTPIHEKQLRQRSSFNTRGVHW